MTATDLEITNVYREWRAQARQQGQRLRVSSIQVRDDNTIALKAVSGHGEGLTAFRQVIPISSED